MRTVCRLCGRWCSQSMHLFAIL